MLHFCQLCWWAAIFTRFSSFLFAERLAWLSVRLPKTLSDLPARAGHTAACTTDGEELVVICGGGDNCGLFFKDTVCVEVSAIESGLSEAWGWSCCKLFPVRELGLLSCRLAMKRQNLFVLLKTYRVSLRVGNFPSRVEGTSYFSINTSFFSSP